MAPLLIALDSQIKLLGSNGERTLPLKDLYTNNGKDPLSLKRSEVLKEIFVPNCDGETVFLKLRVRNSLEFSVLSLAVYIEKSVNGEIKKARIIYSGVGSGPTEALETEKALEGLVLNDQMIEGTSRQIAEDITPMPTSVTSPSYKIKMAKVLLKEALRSIP
jgi:CO/xanthine dehydrogenase FAD-binding subunit